MANLIRVVRQPRNKRKCDSAVFNHIATLRGFELVEHTLYIAENVTINEEHSITLASHFSGAFKLALNHKYHQAGLVLLSHQIHCKCF